MSYPIHTHHVREFGPRKRKNVSYENGLEIADRVHDYLSSNRAELVTGPGELSADSIENTNNAGEWVYHLYAKDTTLFAEIRPSSDNKSMNISFATAGRYSVTTLLDLEGIVLPFTNSLFT